MTLPRLTPPDLVGPLMALGALGALVPGSGFAALAVAAGVAWAVRIPRRRRTSLVLAAVLLLGWAGGALRLQRLDAEPLADRVGHALVGARVVVDEPWHGGGYGRIALGRVLGVGGGPVLLRLAERSGPQRGSILVASGSLERPRGPRDGFDERAWLAHQGVHAVLRLHEERVVGARGGAWGVADRVRASALASLGAAGHDDAAQVDVGLAFGGSAGMSQPAVEAFRASGLAHLLAVSGGNVALLVALVVALVWVVGGTRRQAMWIAIGVISLYVGVVGCSASVVRAGIAGAVGCLVWLLGRPRDAWRALGLGLGALLVWNPYAILDPGLQLSFAAVAGILLIAPRIRPWAEVTGVPELLIGALAVTTAATVATAPISWWHFGRATILAAIPANLLAAPAVPLALWSALLATLVAPVVPAAGAGLAWCSRWPAAWILRCAWIGQGLADATPAWLLPVVLGIGVAGVAVRRRH
ncbi:MAG: ComEC/Rec2 family competence protein [Gaiellales bacterium]